MPTNIEKVLFSIVERPGMDDDEISAATGVKPRQQVNQICRGLEAQGLIRREAGNNFKVVNFPASSELEIEDGELPMEVNDVVPIPNERTTGSEGLGIIMILGGALAVGGSFFMNVAAPSELVVNLDLVSFRQLTETAGGFLFLGGWLAVIAARLKEAQ